MKHLLNHVKQELKKHTFDYLLFLTAGVFFLLALHTFRGERFIEFIIMLSFISFYVIWGMYHHVIENTIHLKTVLEYVFIGFIVLFLLKLLILP